MTVQNVIEKLKNVSSINKVNALALLIFVLTAIFSIGHNKSDEHYQILEFAQYKMGKISAEELPWEFKENMRPTVQPWIVVGMVSMLQSVQITNPFFITLLFRLMTALLLWLIMVKFNRELCKIYFKDKTWLILFCACTFFLWYVPFNSVRFSSESYATIFLLSGLYCLFKDLRNIKFLSLAGLFMGLSVMFKAQMGLCVLGVFIGLLFLKKVPLIKLLSLFAGIFGVVLFGLFLDIQFYDEFVFTPYNFIKANLVGGKASEFGTAPFYYYLIVFLMVTIPPINLVLPVAFFSGLHKLKMSPIVWAIVPYLLAHSIIAHKEVRFLLPVQYLMIFVTVYGLSVYFKDKKIRNYQRNLIKVAVVLNSLVLLYMGYKPAKGKVRYQKFLYEHIAEGNHIVISTKKDYYKIMGDMNTTFYRPKNLKSYYVNTTNELASFLNAQHINTAFYVHRGYAFSGTLPGYTLKKVFGLYPEFIENLPFVNAQKIRTDCIYLVIKN